MERCTQVALVFPSGGVPLCGVRRAGHLLKHEISTHLMRLHEIHEISREISDSLAMGYLTRSDEISDEIGWDLMGSDEITQMLDSLPSNSHIAVMGLTPREAGVNAVENSALTPRFKCAANVVLLARKSLSRHEM